MSNFEAEITFSFHDVNGDHAVVKVEKMGGGTTGKKYEGSWQVIIDGPYGATGVMNFRSGNPYSHFDVACRTYEYYLEDREEY